MTGIFTNGFLGASLTAPATKQRSSERTLSEMEELIVQKGNSDCYSKMDHIDTVLKVSVELCEIDGFLKNNVFIEQRACIMSQKIAHASDIADETILLLANGSFEDGSLQEEIFHEKIDALLSRLEGILNTTYLDEHIFSGTRSGHNAVSKLNDMGPIPIHDMDVVDHSYFKGQIACENPVYLSLQETLTLTSVTGGHKGFEELIRVLRVAKGLCHENRNPLVRNLMDLAESAKENLVSAQVKTIQNEHLVRNINQSLTTEQHRLTILYNEQCVKDPRLCLKEYKEEQTKLKVQDELFASQIKQQDEFLNRLSRI